MMNRDGHRIRIAAMLCVLCLFFVVFNGCAPDRAANTIQCIDEEYNAYPETLALALPSYAVKRAQYTMYAGLETRAATEVFDAHAVPALESGIARHWYPQHLATVVIAVDRNRTMKDIGGWADLTAANEDVGISDNHAADRQLLFAAIAYGLEGEGFTLDTATGLLKKLRAAGHLFTRTFEPPIVICYDFQAAAMIKSGLNIDIVIPREGTLTYERGLLSNRELGFAGDAGASLLAVGFRLPDGRCDPALYPAPAAYENAHRIEDFAHFSTVCQNANRIFRRDVQRVRLYSSADAREHQLFALLYMIVMVMWVASVISRAMQGGVRRAALLIGAILLGWIILRLVKYQMVEANALNRYLWYGFYPFQLGLPLALLWLAWMIDRPDEESAAPVWLRFLIVGDALLAALVFTNDLHGLVFRLDPGNPGWSSEYTYGVGYYIVLAACVLPLLASLFLLFFKSGRNPRKKGLIYPLALVPLLGAYGYGYITRIPIAWESDFTMVVGLFTLLYLEAAMRTGLIPVNTKYTAVFTHSSLGMQILDSARRTVLSSASASPHDDATVMQALEVHPLPVQEDVNTLLFAAGINGGYALWQEDISTLNRLHTQIEESVRKLTRANAVLAGEEKIKRAMGEENARTQLMLQLDAEISRHANRLSEMIESLERAADQEGETARIAMLLCYMKRRCNLFFRERETGDLPADELGAYLEELAEIAGHAGVKTAVASGVVAPISMRRATLFYDFFYQAIDWAAMRDCPTMLANLVKECGNTALRLLPAMDAESFAPDSGLAWAIATAGGEFIQKDLGEAVGIALSFPEGGGDVG